MPKAHDVVILGGGPGGYACALRCSDLGLKVALIESDAIGGTCLHRGCVPTRAMLHAASLADAAGDPARRWGIRTSFHGVDVAVLKETRDGVVQRNARAVEHHLRAAGVTLIRGKGELSDASTVAVEGERFPASRALVLATGSRPRLLQGVEPDGAHVLTSDQALALDRIPRSAIVVGGGAIGAEMSQIWNAFGCRVTMLELRPNLVPFEDPDVGRELSRALRRRGIRVHVAADLMTAETKRGSVTAAFRIGEDLRELAADVLLVAIGRDPLTSGLGYEEAGVTLEGGFAVPRDWSTLEVAHSIHAIGDLLPPPSPARAHVAFAEGMVVADAIAGQPVSGIDYVGVPRVTHGLTETACVGLSEAEARASFQSVKVRKMPLAAVAKGLMLGESGMIKVVAEEGGPVLGVHMVGPNASELIGEAAAITNFEASAGEAASLVHAHPTISEALAELNMALAGRPLHQR